MQPRIAVISKSEEARAEFVRRLEAAGAQAPSFESVSAFRSRCGSVHYSGIVIDLKTTMASSGAEKALIAELEVNFPFLRVIQNAATGRLTGSTDGMNLEDEEVFPAFLRERCQHFRGRGVRMLRRHRVHFNLTLLNDDGSTILTNSLDASAEGLFVISAADHAVGTHVRFRVKEFADPAPIRGEVRWSLPWGVTSGMLPGFGVKFIELTESQRLEIEKRFRNPVSAE